MVVLNQDKPKILFVADVPLGDPSSGSEKMVNRQATGLARIGMQVYAIVRLSKADKAGFRKVGDIEVGQYYAPPSRFLRFSYQHLKYPAYFCEKFCRLSPFYAVIAHQPFNCFVLLMKRKTVNVPLMYNFHSPSHEEYLLSNKNLRTVGNIIPLLMRRKIERYCLQSAGVVMTHSQYMKQKAIDIHHIADDRIVVNPGGVDLDRFHPPEKRGYLKEKLGLPSGRVHLLTVRNLEPRMGLDNLLRAITLLKEKFTDVHLVIGGEGPERPNLENLIHRYELFDEVTMTGFISAEQLPKYYGAADFFVLPTRDLEGFGLVTLESIACGTPVLGTPVGGTVEILSGLDSQFLFSDVTPQAMAAGIARTIANWFNDQTKYDRLRGRCREYAVKNYSWQRHIDQLKSIIDSLQADPFT